MDESKNKYNFYTSKLLDELENKVIYLLPDSENRIQISAEFDKFRFKLTRQTFQDTPITEKYLISKGFVYERFRAGGQDSWAGMDIWTLKTGTGQFITLRGNPGLLKFAGYYDSDIQTEEELDFLIKLLTRKS
jgi:hypothetical protein